MNKSRKHKSTQPTAAGYRYPNWPKTYREWILNAEPQVIANACESFGDPRTAYDKLTAEMQRRGWIPEVTVARKRLTRDERSVVDARVMLAKLKPYEHWIAELEPEKLAEVTQVFGSPEACYERFAAGIKAVADSASASGRKK